MACDKAGRGRYAPTRVVGIQDVEVINPGAAVVLKGDDTRRRATVKAVFVRISGPGEHAVIYSLCRETADAHAYEFERPAALVELADPPAADVADDLTATTPGGVIEWKADEHSDTIRSRCGRFNVYRNESALETPVYFAMDGKRAGDKSSPYGVLPEVKAWCEARLSEPLAAREAATVAGVNGVPEVIPAADAPGF